jgi:hypothetical protein
MSLLPQLVELRQQTLDKFLVEKTFITDDVQEFGVYRIAGAELARDPVVFTKLMTLPGCAGVTARACASALGEKVCMHLTLYSLFYAKILTCRYNINIILDFFNDSLFVLQWQIAESINLLDFTFQKISSIDGREIRLPR